MIKLKEAYDNDKVKQLISRHMKKRFEEITQKEFETYCILWYSMLIEFLEPSDVDISFETMKNQMVLKQHFWVNK